MRTSKAFSTISYNTDEFLKIKLSDLVSRGILDFWAYVEHLPEDDETKSHKHLFMIPSRLIETTSVTEDLKELDIKNPLEKPLGCIACTSSKFADWYLYTQHDKAYLQTKGQARKFKYSINDFKVSCNDYFNELIHTIDLSKYKGLKTFINAVEDGIPFDVLVINGQVPIQQLSQYNAVYEMVRNSILNRNGRQSHTPKDSDTVPPKKP